MEHARSNRGRPAHAALTALILTATFSSAAAAALACEPVEALTEQLGPGRLLLLGELHGTEQSPAFAFSAACGVAAKGTETIVALELSSSEQGRVDRYLLSAGSAADREALLAHPIWTRSYQDGRNSRAMLALIEAVRERRRQGSPISILFFDVSAATGQGREAGMAERLLASADAHPQAVHIVLTGNRHSRISAGIAKNRDYEPMGFLLKEQLGAARILALDAAYAGGSAWICTPECGVTQLRGNRTSGASGSIEIDESTRPSGHHGWYHVGALSASVPAVGEHAVPTQSPPRVEPAATTEPIERTTVPVEAPAIVKLQGRWQAYQEGSSAWTIKFDGLSFYAETGPDDWYRGTIFVRPDELPAEIDLLIEDCVCGYKGQSSNAIYRWDGDRMTLAAPRPNAARPLEIRERNGEVVTLRRIEE